MRQSSIWHWSPIFAKRVNGLFKLAAGFAGMAAVGAVLLVGIAANAQTSNGTIEGSVVDATGAGVAKATVSILGVHTGATKTTATNGVGEMCIRDSCSPSPRSVLRLHSQSFA